MKRFLSLLLTASIAISMLGLFAYAADETDYTIVDPYANVDWNTFTTYKANLHTHSTASDGSVPLADMIEAYYREGYDILAMTDHGVINNGWNKVRKTNGIFNGFRKSVPLSDADYERITTGADRDGRGMIDITGGIECNMAVFSKTHVNGYFTTWGGGVWGNENDYKTATVEIEKAGGYSVLNHPGDWVYSKAQPERAHDPKYIAYFADIFTSSKTCLGMEIVNGHDTISHEDRAMWDELLQVVIPTGRNIWAFSNDDSEEYYEIGRSFELFPLASNTVENVKNAMINGSFFAASKYDRSAAGDGSVGDGNVPVVTNITVDQAANTISVSVDPDRDCRIIEWIANGEVISNDYTVDLNDFEDVLGCYIRFQLRGEGGITYSQAFELQYEGRVDKPVPERLFGDGVIGDINRKFFQTLGFALMQVIIRSVASLFGVDTKI